MADIDILFKAEQAEQVKGLMTDLGFTVDYVGGNHDCYGLQPYMKIEMHRRLVTGDSPYSGYLDETWNRARLKENCQYTYELSKEDSFVYLLIHLTKHYAGGGTGIRSFLDIWVYRRRYKDEMDWDYIEAELDKVGLREFTDNILGLCEVWFGNAESYSLYEEMAQYVFSSGTYGIQRHSVISSLGIRAGKKSLPPKYAYWLKLFFPPVEILKNSYPFLNKLPQLQPACWVLRGIKYLLFKRRHMLHMIGQVHSISRGEMAKIESFHKKAGLLR